jgi:hypothetical protein
LAGFIFNDNSGIKNVSDSNIAYRGIDLNKTVKKISDDDLKMYLNNDYLSNTDMVILDDGAAPDVEQKVEAVSDDDLNKYLQDAATTTNLKKGL